MAGFGSPKGAKIVGAPAKVDVDAEDVVLAARQAAFDYNKKVNDARMFGLVRVRAATKQVVAGLKYGLDLDLAPTQCTKAQAAEVSNAAKLAENCAVTQGSPLTSIHAMVVRQEWKATEEDPEAQWSVAFQAE